MVIYCKSTMPDSGRGRLHVAPSKREIQRAAAILQLANLCVFLQNEPNFGCH
jgi:hypothetical protein